MAFILITPAAVYQGRTVAAVVKRSNLHVSEEDFRDVGKDRVATMIDGQSLAIRAEIADLERYSLAKLFRPDALALPSLMQFAILGLVLISLFR